MDFQRIDDPNDLEIAVTFTDVKVDSTTDYCRSTSSGWVGARIALKSATLFATVNRQLMNALARPSIPENGVVYTAVLNDQITCSEILSQ